MRTAAVGVAIGAVAWAIATSLAMFGMLDAVELASYDARLTATHDPADARDDIAIVEINESSLATLEPVFGRWPWPRVAHAGVIDYLSRAGARVIAYDVFFLEHDRRGAFPIGDRTMSGAESDEALATSIGRAGNVILAASALFEGLASDTGPPPPAPPLPGITFDPGQGFQHRPYLALPIEPFANVAAGVGHTALVLDSDGTARRILPFVEAQGRGIPWLGLTAALTFLRSQPSDVSSDASTLRVGESRLPLSSDPAPGDPPQPSRQMVLRLTGPYASHSFYDVLRAEETFHSGGSTGLDPSVFRDKIVFVGLTAPSLNDVFASPFGGPAMPGVQFHAAAADDVLSGVAMKRASTAVDGLVTATASVSAGLLSVVLPVGWALVPIALLAAAGVWALTALVGQSLWIGLAAPVLGLAVATFGGTAWQYFIEGRQKRQVKSLFGRFVSPDVFAHLMAHPDVATLGGSRREMSVLFSDIRGFTTAAERAAPEAVVAQLNEYFSAMVEVLFKHEGTLDKFVGDMVMGLFGAPVANPHHADRAVAAAIEMVEVLERLNTTWANRGMPRLDIGIGVNSGEMIAGNIGSASIMSYTVIGDAVNLGARLESLNKEFGTRILISEATRARLTMHVSTREIGSVKVKGKSAEVLVHAVDVPDTIRFVEPQRSEDNAR